ncbi:MAG: phospho-N-acetylmuramoyl-pentapeptide-transferase [Clostridia bacterium]|nr:phospho-N-acetylmuramoyl-pentapeptide-transferase [Clostridia bacterium]
MNKTSVIAFAAAFLVTVIAVKLLIPVLRRLKMGQRILTIGPAWHMNKQGTPTMGGIAFFIGSATVSLIFAIIADGGVDVTLTLSIAYVALNGLVGVLDDGVKLKRKQNEGLSAFSKFFLQILLATFYVIALRANGLVTTELYVPFLSKSVDIGRLYYPFALLFLTGFSNAVNLTDGLDGLCSSVTAAVALFFAVIGMRYGQYATSVLMLTALGACLGFLVFNFHPAKVFMGDTGSLFLGSAVSAAALVSGRATLIFLVGIVYLIEALSVVLQVGYYKLTKKRLFLMAPMHHHLEKKGYSEVKITFIFTALTLAFAAIAYLFG